MTQKHLITPPSELVRDWAQKAQLLSGDDPVSFAELLCNKAARWGSDQELEACCEWLSVPCPSYGRELFQARRRKPQSLKEQAKFAAAVLRSPDETCSIAELQQHWHTICNALEQLND